MCNRFLVPCTINPGAFTHERVFEIMHQGHIVHRGVSPLQYLRDGLGNHLRPIEKPARSLFGLVECREVRKDIAGSIINLPDGTNLAVPEKLMQGLIRTDDGGNWPEEPPSRHKRHLSDLPRADLDLLEAKLLRATKMQHICNVVDSVDEVQQFLTQRGIGV